MPALHKYPGYSRVFLQALGTFFQAPEIPLWKTAVKGNMPLQMLDKIKGIMSGKVIPSKVFYVRLTRHRGRKVLSYLTRTEVLYSMGCYQGSLLNYSSRTEPVCVCWELLLLSECTTESPGQEPGASHQDRSGLRFKTLGSLAKGSLVPSFGRDAAN